MWLLRVCVIAVLTCPLLAFHGEEVALTCVPCNATEFCHAGLRTRCPTHSLSDFGSFSASDIDDCVCVPGYLRAGDACNLGEEPYWFIEGVLQTCAEFPRRVTVVHGAWRAEQCVCVPGYSEIEAFGNSVPGACAKCPLDSYNSQHNASCVRCPAHSSHLEQARTLITACTCDAGFSGLDGGPCVACEPGFAKPLNGSQNCETCGPNAYSNGSASAACVVCHGNSTAVAGSAVVADCRCDPGFELVDGLCAQCAAGKFKGARGNEVCELCVVDTFAGAAGATVCVPCHANSHSEATRERCLCDAGYVQGSAGELHPTCAACAVDTYQNLTGQTACVDCDTHAQTLLEASPDISACVCNVGYRDIDYGGCGACAPGEFKTEVDETAACEDCPVDSYSPSASSVAEACLCNAGFDGPDGGPCAACEFGKSKAGNGSTPCALCAANTFSDTEAATSCTQCFDHALAPAGSTDLSDCICDPVGGYVEVSENGERVCSACAPGKFATSDGSETGSGCVNCSFGTFTNTHGETVCDTCPTNTSSHSYPRTECECDAGFQCNSIQLALCLARSDGVRLNANPMIASDLFRVRVLCTASISYDNLLIQNQPPGQYYGRTYMDNLITNEQEGYLGFRHVPGESAGIWEFEGGVARHDWDSQTYIHDYTRMHWKEVKSDMVQFNSALNESLINLTPAKFVMIGIRFRVLHNSLIEIANSMQTILNWVYIPYFYALLIRVMVLNGQLKIDFVSGDGTHIFGQFDTWISVFAQFYDGYVHVKVQWEDGTPAQHFSIAINSAAGDPAYDAAHGGEYSLSLGQVSSTVELKNTRGLSMRLDTTATFDVSHFFLDYGCTDTSLLDTLAFKTNCEQPTNIKECHRCDGDCESCNTDTFKVETGYSPNCTACQPNAQSPPTSTVPSACLCNAGFIHEQDYTTPPPYTCAPCAAGSYTESVGTYSCIACPTNHWTPSANFPWNTATDCVACGLCPAHEYDASRGGLGCGLDAPVSCVACPANSDTTHSDTFEDRNVNVTACACNAGYYGPLGGPCMLCPRGSVKLERLDRDTVETDCVECPTDTYMATQDTVCRDCLAHSTSPAGSFEKQHCACDAGRENIDPEIRNASDAWGAQLSSQDLSPDFIGAFEDGGLTVCRRCVRGLFKALSGQERCEPCVADSFQNATGQVTCVPCPANMSSLSAATACYCDPAFENVDGEHHDCTLCRSASYKTEFGNQVCTTCDACLDDQQVDVRCAPGNNITCKACQLDSWNPSGSTLRGPCLCNAGYELSYNESESLDGYSCLSCLVGEYRTTNMNNAVLCATCGSFTFTTTTATVSCLPCTNVCDDTLDTETTAYYVSVECTPSTDIVCAKCTVCPEGSYANRTCGVAFNSDRSDTTCDRCPAGSYCPGNGTRPQVCPAHSTSPTGSVLAKDCRCRPGYYQTDVHLYGDWVGEPIFDELGLSSHQCFACSIDTFCPGDGTFLPCPTHSFTTHSTSSQRLDCQCFPGYYRDGEQATFETAFECALCTPNDYCFNNSRYNCSDERMLSDVGSAYFANCTCMVGFYNNDTRCEACPVDTYCIGDGLSRACPVLEWTSHEQQYSECYCRPGLYSPASLMASPKGCVVCPVGSFCPGEYDARWNCTAHSTSAAGSATDIDCLCLPGFGNVSLHALLPDNTPTFHACAACDVGLVKETTSNSACAACTVCLPDPDGVYELQACRSDFDARCGACDPCTNGSIWTSQACALKVDAVCSRCAVCDYEREFLDDVCTSQQDALCRNITYGLQCPSGAFAGGHTERTDSFCAPCAYHDTFYFGQRLHEAVSAGTRYGDAYSCEINCLGLSRMRDTSNHSLGCVSCETGNVLLREFALYRDAAGRATACQFTCRHGFEFDAAQADCFAPVLRASAQNTFSHSLDVSNWGRTDRGFLFTVTHTNHSRFVVVVGDAKPSSCRHDECCFSELWRVSEIDQLGLKSTASEDCSRSIALPHRRVLPTVLEFEIIDLRMAEIGRCTFVNVTKECTFVVSLVDTVLRRSISRVIVTRTTRAMSYAFFNAAQQYIPLDTFSVDVVLAYRDSQTSTYLIITQVRSVHGTQNVTLRVQGMTPVKSTCPHYTFQNDTTHPELPSVNAREDRVYSFASYWRGPASMDVAKLFYSLRASPTDVMDIAAVRNVSLLNPVCAQHLHSATIQLGMIKAVAGLGETAVLNMYRLSGLETPTATVRGELGSLVSFIAESISPFTTEISIKSILAAHVMDSHALTNMRNATVMKHGILDFTYPFRRWCRSHTKCVYEYLNFDARGRTMHVVKCSPEGRSTARVWLAANFGVVNDDGHVDALCAHVSAAKHVATSVMVNTMAYLDKTWHTQQNFSSAATQSFVWPNMLFTTTS